MPLLWQSGQQEIESFNPTWCGQRLLLGLGVYIRHPQK
tara:strand:- start:26 stop:139 length:114 start_codon:yes stop_codon:yes gene_type:complete